MHTGIFVLIERISDYRVGMYVSGVARQGGEGALRCRQQAVGGFGV